MSEDIVTFNIRCEKSLFELKIETPGDWIGFIGKLKEKLNVEDTDEIVLLCPTPEGKMMEINSDDDIKFLKKTKLCYDAVNREIHCSVELVAIILHKKLPDDPKAQMMILSTKIEKIASQFAELSQSIDDKLENNASNILRSIRWTFFENSQPDSVNTTDTNVSDELKHVPKLEKLKSAEPEPQKLKKEEMSPQILPCSSKDNLTDESNQQKKSSSPTVDIDTLLEKLKQEGFTNTIQNIIVLKRFDHDYEKAITHLKSK